MNSGNNESRWEEILEMTPKIETGESDAVEKSPDGRYLRSNEILGRGAFKNVYKGFDEIDGIEVAWNQVNIEALAPDHLKMLYSEVYLLKMLKHENVIRSYASWVDDKNKTINMITELLTSGNLRQYRKKHKSVDMKAIKNWARQILRGLDYLHSQNPPIIHRDLKCENIFVNGNHGEVKIGDLGLATILHQPTARSVIGTPEFMAPELYEEEYNEAVDIYSFGMCMLELVTCEYPYSECRNHAHIYKKVTSGIKPAALGKLNDPEVKSFIEKCLAPASQRPTASELLNAPFLLCEYPANNSLLQLSDSVPNSNNSKKSPFTDLDTSCKSTCESMIEASVSCLKLHRYNERYKFSLKGEKLSDKLAHLRLRIADYPGWVWKIRTEFSLNADTASSIASEMVETLDLFQVDVDLIAELINNIIVQFFPRWGSSSGSFRHEKYVRSDVGECSYTKEASKTGTHSELTYNGAPMLLEASSSQHAASSALNAILKKDLLASNDAVEKPCRSIEQSLMDESVKDSGSILAGSWVTEASSSQHVDSSTLNAILKKDLLASNNAVEKPSRSIEQSLMDESVKDSGSILAGSWVTEASSSQHVDSSTLNAILKKDLLASNNAVEKPSRSIEQSLMDESVKDSGSILAGSWVTEASSSQHVDSSALNATLKKDPLVSDYAVEKPSRSMEQSSMDESVKDSGSILAGSWVTSSSDMRFSISSLSLRERENDSSTDLKTELDEIYVQYQQRFRELLRMRDAEIENAKRKWVRKNINALR